MPDPWFQLALVTVEGILALAVLLVVVMIWSEYRKEDQP